MKKLFLFFILSALTLSISSCSDDDSNPTDNNNNTGGIVSFNVDGIQKNFDKIIIEEMPTTTDGEKELIITAYQNDNPSETIIFPLIEGKIGTNNHSGTWQYKSNGQTYTQFNEHTITSIFQINDTENLKGSFSGSLGYSVYNTGTGNYDLFTENITNGNIDINR